jgi:hypothetical protein
MENAEEPFFWFISLNHIRYALIAIFAGAIVKLNKKLDDIEFSALLGFALFFLLLSTVRYYYLGLVALPFVFYRQMNNLAGIIFFAAFLLINAFGRYVEKNTFFCFIYNSYYSAVFIIAILLIIIFFMYTSKNITTAPPDNEKQI